MTKYYLTYPDRGIKQELFLEGVSEEDIEHIVFVASSMLGFMDSLELVIEGEGDE